MKYKVIINFSIYNKYLINEFKVNDILEIKQVVAYSDHERYVIVKFNDKTYDIPVDIFMFCTEKI